MNEWTPRIIILALLALVLGVPLAFEPAAATRDVAASGDKLIIYSPHNEQIRHEFARGFNLWRQSQDLPPVIFDWRAGGGTSDIRKKILADFTAKARAGTESDGIGADLFFGGGDYEHGKIAKGVKVNRDGEEIEIPITTPAQFPPGKLEEIFPSPRIGGEKLYDKNLSWVGTALSSFGIVYNRDVLKMLGLREPITWADMRDPGYRHWIALADPGHSGSIAATYNAILRRSGWTEGWATLRRIFANARYFTAGASKVPVDVSAGEAAAGMCIDFYGRFQAGAIGQDRVGYVDPPFMTAITADPITILRGAPQPKLANDFVLWVLSPGGQRLWQGKAGSPGGPEKYELRRLPIRRDIYTSNEMKTWVDQVNPFEIAKPFADGMPDLYGTVTPVAHALAIDIHDELSAAWSAIVDHPDHPRRSEMLALFDAMPPELTLTWPDADMASNWQAYLDDGSHPRHGAAAEGLGLFVKTLTARWKDGDQQLKDRLRWSLFFRDNYRRIVAIAAGG